MEKPQLTEQHRQLERLAGKWIGEENVHAPPYPREGTARATFNARMDLDGLFLIADYVEDIDGKPFLRGHGVYGWDPKKEQFSLSWFDNKSAQPPAQLHGKWIGDTLTLEGDTGAHKSRLVYEVSANGLAVKAQGSPDGKDWQTIVDGKFRRG